MFSLKITSLSSTSKLKMFLKTFLDSLKANSFDTVGKYSTSKVFSPFFSELKTFRDLPQSCSFKSLYNFTSFNKSFNSDKLKLSIFIVSIKDFI